MRRAFLVLVLAVSACTAAPEGYWAKADASPAQRDADLKYCVWKSEMFVFDSGLLGMAERHDYVNQCMTGGGYQWRQQI